MYIIRTLLKINNLSLEIWVLSLSSSVASLKSPSVSTLLETSSVVLTLTLVFSLISGNWIVNMNFSSIDFLSRFIHSCSSELNLTKVNKSESSTVAILTSNNSSSNYLAAAFKSLLQFVLINSEWKISNNNIARLLSLLLSW